MRHLASLESRLAAPAVELFNRRKDQLTKFRPSGGLLAVPGTLRSNNAHNVANARDTKKSHQRKFNVRWIYNPVDMQIFFSPPDWHIKGGKSSRLSDSCQNCPGLKNGRKRVEVSTRCVLFLCFSSRRKARGMEKS